MLPKADTFIGILATAEQINHCSYSSWSPYFSEHIPEAKVLKDIPQAFIDYLNSDSIKLPPPKYEDKVAANSDNDYSDWESEENDEKTGEVNKTGKYDPHASNPCREFADFDRKVQEVVTQWKRVMPKLNWSAPKDARWILINNSLECTLNADVYLLLNASDHIAHDLDGDIYKGCVNLNQTEHLRPELVLKKWISGLNPALEFRIFVRNRRIVGVSQRDLNHYPFLEELHPKLLALFAGFQKDVIGPSSFPLQTYIMDVYIPAPHKNVIIIDINPSTRKWGSLLFTWHELLNMCDDGPFELRLITETNLGAMARKEYSENQVPIEVIDALVNTEAMVELAKTWGKKEAEEGD